MKIRCKECEKVIAEMVEEKVYTLRRENHKDTLIYDPKIISCQYCGEMREV